MATPRKVNYLSNKALLAATVASKEKGEMSNELAGMLLLLCQRYGRKGNFVNYSYNDDMQAYALMMLVRTWKSFNPEKSTNAFAFFTQCIKNSFKHYLNVERKHRTGKDKVLIDMGLNPSYGYEDENSCASNRTNYGDDEQDYDTAVTTFKDLNRSLDTSSYDVDLSDAAIENIELQDVPPATETEPDDTQLLTY